MTEPYEPEGCSLTAKRCCTPRMPRTAPRGSSSPIPPETAMTSAGRTPASSVALGLW